MLPRALLVLLVGLAAPACFALFTLDDYGPAAGGEGGAGDATIEAEPPSEASSDSGDAADVYVPGRRIFVTRNTWGGDFGGINQGNDRCRQAASSAGLTGTFQALLADDRMNSGTALVSASVPVRLLTGVLVASSGAELFRSGPLHAIDVDETGKTVGMGGDCDNGGLVVWTGMLGDGGSAGSSFNCQGWQSAGGPPSALVGLVQKGAGAWVAGCAQRCIRRGALYCVEQ